VAKILTDRNIRQFKPAARRRAIRDTASRGLFLVIQPTGYKSWMMRFRRGAGIAKVFLGPLDISGRKHDGELVIGQPLSLVQARQLAAKINTERASGIDVAEAHRSFKRRRRAAIADAAANSFGVCVKDYVEQYARPKNRSWKQISATLGLDADLKVRPNGLADRWADRGVSSIDDGELFAVIEEARRLSIPGARAKADRPSEARARKVHAALSQLYGWLLRRRKIDVNPMANLHPPAPAAARDRVLNTGEIATVWSAFDSAKQPFTAVLRLLLLTGARLNEIACLEWSEVSDDFSTIKLNGDRTKNHRTFVIPLPPMARDIIAAQPREGRFVFSNTGGIAPISGWSKAKERVDTAAAIPPWVIHDLRRTTATGMAEKIGIAPHIIEAVLNHVSGHKGGVAGVYNRAIYAEEKRSALEKWADHVSSVVAKQVAESGD
jgi:integrase